MKKIKILLVDNDLAFAEKVSSFLKARGIGVIIKNNAEEAKKILNTTAFDLVVTDYSVPGISGFELCREIKKSTNGSVPVLIVYSTSQLKRTIRGIPQAQLPDDYLIKHFLI